MDFEKIKNAVLNTVDSIAKVLGETPKKGLKTGQNGVKFFSGPHTC